MALVLSRIGIEDRHASVDVTVRHEHLVRLRVVGRLGGRGEVLRIVAPVTLAEMADLEEEFAVPVELQDLSIPFAVAGDPEVALGVDGQSVLVQRPLVAGPGPSPRLEHFAVLIELHHKGRGNAAVADRRLLGGVVFVLLERSGTVQDPHVVVRGVDEHAADGPENPIPLKFRPGGIDLERWYAARWLLGRNRAFDDGDPSGDDDCEESYGVTSVHFHRAVSSLRARVERGFATASPERTLKRIPGRLTSFSLLPPRPPH